MGTAAIPVAFQGMPVRALANQLMQLSAGSTNDNIIVLVQLMGGNDGLNTLVPVGQYDTYLEQRENIALPNEGDRKYILMNENDPLDKQLGLHPEMTHVKEMYDENMVAVVQNVAYENPDLSHFRGRDIWFMGGGANDKWHSGWMGRYLDGTYEGYPDGYPNDDAPDPLGLEFGYTQSLIFQREEGIPAGLSIIDPDTFLQLISGGGVEPPDWLPDSYYGDEMQYLMDLELTSNKYAERIKEVFDAGTNTEGVDYPESYPGEVEETYKTNDLGWQFKTVARLLSGGSKTKMFLVKINGFDSHADQTLPDDPTQGVHAALLYYVSASVKAFYDDLKAQGMDQKVITMTVSEFGRRVSSNASFGTDHGMAAPVLLFGPMLKPGIYGNTPDLSDLNDGNLKFEFDYRQIYTSVLVDWLSAPPEIVEEVRWEDFVDSRLDLFQTPDSVQENGGMSSASELSIFPNPATDQASIEFNLNKSGYIELGVYDINGRKVLSLYEGNMDSGKQIVTASVQGLKSGYYLVRLRTGLKVSSKKLIVK